MIFGALFSYGQDTVYLSPAPVYHAAPLRYTGVIQALGGTVVLMQRFDPENFLEAVQEYGVTDTQVVPTMFVRLLKLPEEVRASYDTSSLKTVVHAAAPCPVEVKQQMMEWLGPIVHEYYASTEANGATYVGPEDWLAHPGTVGRSLLGTPRICDPAGAELPAGEVGTIYFERDEEPFTYHGDSDKTASTRHPDHPFWSTVGDLGYLDDEGYLFLTDRKAFMIISGGVNIYPQEIEDAVQPAPVRARHRGDRGSRRGDGGAGGRLRPAGRLQLRTTWPPSSRRTPGSGSRTSRCRASSSSPTTCRVRRPASWSSSSCATATRHRRRRA